jgi:cell division protein FtsI (penicillin-binding protein 3)
VGRAAERDAPGPRRRQSRPRRRGAHRHAILLAGLILSIAVLLFRLMFVQVLNGSKYASYAKSESQQTVVLPASRGAIYDRNGDLLAVSVARYDVVADDFLIPDPSATAGLLAPLLGENRDVLVAELSQKSGYVIVARQVTSAVESKIEALNLEGITFQSDTARVYPGGAIFQPLIGNVNSAGFGYAALENAYDAVLGGKPGSEVVSVAPSGLQLPSGASNVVTPKAGTSLVLTLDLPLQVEVTKDVEAQMRATHSSSGMAIVENVHTGAILAMVDLVTGPKGAIVPADQNLIATSVLQPGSVMKLVTIAFSLQDGLISPSTTFTVPYSIDVGGYAFKDADVHGTERLPVSQILAQSSNVGTIEISQKLGLTRLAKGFDMLGFGHLSGLGWPAESSGFIGTPSGWYGSAAASVPIGTGVAVTPVQILDAYNAVANSGVMVEPNIVEGTIANGKETFARPAPTHRVLQPATVAALVPMLTGVVHDETGTALLASIRGYEVAGKTGTAQVPDGHGSYIPGDWNATFVGFAPANAPQLSALVSFNHKGGVVYGGTEAAPVFAKFMQYALSHFDIAPPKTFTSR